MCQICIKHKDDQRRLVCTWLYTNPLYSRIDMTSAWKKDSVSCLRSALTRKMWTSSMLKMILRHIRRPSRVLDIWGKCLVVRRLASSYLSAWQNDQAVSAQLNMVKFLQPAWWQAVCLADDETRQECTEHCSVSALSPASPALTTV